MDDQQLRTKMGIDLGARKRNNAANEVFGAIARNSLSLTTDVVPQNMKHLVIIILALVVVGCHRTPVHPTQSEVLALLASHADSVLVGEFSEPSLLTNVGFVWKAYPFKIIGTVTGVQDVANLVHALIETGAHGDSGLCFSGALPEQVYVDSVGRPIFSALVHVPTNHVIISTNIIKLGDTIFSIWPTGEVRHGYDIAAGNNARYGALALETMERLWPEELDRRDMALSA